MPTGAIVQSTGRLNQGTQPVNDQYRAHWHKLSADLKRLAAIKSQTARLDYKRGALSEYGDYLDGVLLSGTTSRNKSDSVLVWCAVWSFDVGLMARGLELATYAINTGMAAPDGFNRSLVEVVTEEISRAALFGKPVDYVTELSTVWHLVEGKDKSDIITAKLCKAYGLALLGGGHIDRAEQLLNQAARLYPRIGVKSHLKKLAVNKPIATTNTAAKTYDLPTKKAAAMLSVSVPTFLKYACLNVAELPYICFESGKHKAFRFCKTDVEAFGQKRKHGG